MNRKYKITLGAFLLTLVLIAGYLLRIRDYNKIPPPGESSDEYSFTWLGLSLIQTGKPIAGSDLEPYHPILKYIDTDDYFHRTYTPNPFPIVEPWFDHPPLFGLMTGSYSYLRGVENFADASVSFIRKPMIFIGIVNILLVFSLAFLLFGYKPALFAVIIYATEPYVVISSRMAQAENLLIFLFLSSLLSLNYFFKTKKHSFFWLSISIAGVATLVKVSGWAIALSLIVLIFVSIKNDKDRYRYAISAFLGVLLIFLLFPLYGAIYSWDTFWGILGANSSRFVRDGVGIFNMLILRQNITKTFGSGWISLGWFSLAILGSTKARNRKLIWIIIPTLSYLLIYMIFGSRGYGWYGFPFLPFLFIATSIMFVKTLKLPNHIFNLLFIFLPSATMLHRFFDSEYISENLIHFRFPVAIVFLVLFLKISFRNSKLINYLYVIFMILFFVISIGLNIYTNYQIDVDSWYNSNRLQSLSA